MKKISPQHPVYESTSISPLEILGDLTLIFDICVAIKEITIL